MTYSLPRRRTRTSPFDESALTDALTFMDFPHKNNGKTITRLTIFAQALIFSRSKKIGLLSRARTWACIFSIARISFSLYDYAKFL